MCNFSALQVALGSDMNLCYVDYNGETVSINFTPTDNQDDYNKGLSTALCNIVSRINLNFVNGLYITGCSVRLGGNLIEDTIINYNGKIFTFRIDSNNYFTNTNNSFSFYNSLGNNPSDLVNVLFNRFNLFVSQIATNADRQAISYYATTNIASSVDSLGASSYMGVKSPTTNDGSVPPPAIDPERTAFVRSVYDVATDKSYVEIYGRNIKINGIGRADFDNLLSLKRMTTTERNAIDSGLLIGGMMIFNTTVNKGQMYDGSSWNNLF